MSVEQQMLDELVKIRKVLIKMFKHTLKKDRGAEYKASEANP